MAPQGNRKGPLDRLLDELDRKSKQQSISRSVEGEWECRRTAPREAFRADCAVRFVPTGYTRVSEIRGRTRNLSRGGVGLLTRRPFNEQDALEVQVKVSPEKTLCLAGLVVSCRYAGHGHYEVGVSLKVAQETPVFTDDSSLLMSRYPWIRYEQETPVS